MQHYFKFMRMNKAMKSNLKLAIQTALFSGAMLTATTASASDKALLDTLLSNGSINSTQYNRLLNTPVNSAPVSEKSSSLSGVKMTLNKKGLRFASADKAFKMKIGGRFHLQTGYHVGAEGVNDNDGNRMHTDGTEVRRARIHVKGLLWKDWKYVAEFDFADNHVVIKDLSTTYKGLDWLQITLGHQKQNMSMELQESSNDIMFIERSAVNSLTEKTFNRALGLHFKMANKDWSAQVGFYGDSTDNNKDAGDEGWGLSSRVSYAPINTKTNVLHVGASAGYRNMQDGKVKLGYETTHMSNLKLTKAEPTNVNSMTMAIAELAYMQGPFSVQSEYAHMWLSRNSASELNFDAWYVQAAWTLTGESRSYKGSDGEFKRLKPHQEFGFGEGTGWGAVELAIRYDESDLNSGDIIGGTEKAFTVAANWYLNQNIRLIADYRTAFDVSERILTDKDSDGNSRSKRMSEADNVHAFTARIQLTF